MSDSQALLAYLGEHWFTGFFVALMLLGVLRALVSGALRLCNRVLRACVVTVRGWPPAHLDADGDWPPRQPPAPGGPP